MVSVVPLHWSTANVVEDVVQLHLELAYMYGPFLLVPLPLAMASYRLNIHLHGCMGALHWQVYSSR